jgi:3,4-dihydroxy 2-butanone 4-phosphate synthase/GTP cyclohydrolase II
MPRLTSDHAEEVTMSLNSVAEAIAAIAAGELVVVVDDDDRENEGDLIMAASKATPEQVAFMIRHTSGIICAPMVPERAERLQLTPMVATNRDPMRTAFTVSVDYRVGVTTGISAEERTNTLRALANDNCIATDFLRPGHVFPLISKTGGVLSRSGHTEAATDLARLAGLPEVGILAEVVNDDGTVKRLPELISFAQENGLKLVSIADLIEHRIRTESFVRRIESRPVATPIGEAMVHVYTTPFDDTQHLAVVFGEVAGKHGVPCRIHHEQPLRDLFETPRSQRWLDCALARFHAGGRGVLIYVRDPKIMSLESAREAPEGSDAGESGDRHQSSRLRHERWREIGLGAQVLRDLGISSITLLATQHRQYVGLGGFGIEIAGTEIVES